MKQVVIDNPKLAYTKEQVANLSENDLDKVQGGNEAARTASSTNNDITCCWCTSEVTQPKSDE